MDSEGSGPPAIVPGPLTTRKQHRNALKKQVSLQSYLQHSCMCPCFCRRWCLATSRMALSCICLADAIRIKSGATSLSTAAKHKASAEHFLPVRPARHPGMLMLSSFRHGHVFNRFCRSSAQLLMRVVAFVGQAGKESKQGSRAGARARPSARSSRHQHGVRAF